MVASLLAWVLASTPAGAVSTGAKPAVDCDALYEGKGAARDLVKALACYRAAENWPMVAIMQLNGEGTAPDVAAARATFEKSIRGRGTDIDAKVLEDIIKAREARPKARGPRVEYCDLAGTTIALNYCQARDEERKTRKADDALSKFRAQMAPGARPAFDRAVAAFKAFAPTDADRVYQENIEGSIRNAAAMDQEKRLRGNFMKLIATLAEPGATPPASGRPLADADQALNDRYRQLVRAYAADLEERAAATKDAAEATTYRTYVADHKTKARSAQRFWIKYGEAMAKLAEARWPDAPGIGNTFRALVTEDRILELDDPNAGSQ